ncbi:MAG: alpha/beta fold hydrolase [Balneola sp.]
MTIQREIQFEKFEPVWWAPEVHTQTVIASFSETKDPDSERIEISTPDNDFLELEVVDLKNRKPVVALFHGLEGSSQRHYVQNLMSDLRDWGYSSVALNFRGCGEKINLQKRMYHSGETEDYRTLFSWIKQYFNDPEIYAVGFSLGGNALVKSLGELKNAHPVSKAVAVSPPYDLKGGSLRMNKGFNKVYQKRFLNTLAEKTNLKKGQYPDFPKFTGKSVYDFDDQVTAPVHGFEGADDYYEQCSSKHFYQHVQKPLLVIHSKADSLCPLEFAPFKDLEANRNIRTLFTESGGHVGFISKERGWLNRTIIKWLSS